MKCLLWKKIHNIQFVRYSQVRDHLLKYKKKTLFFKKNCCYYSKTFQWILSPTLLLLSLLQQRLWKCVTMHHSPCPRARRWSSLWITQLLLNKTSPRYTRFHVLQYKIRLLTVTESNKLSLSPCVCSLAAHGDCWASRGYLWQSCDYLSFQTITSSSGS